MSMIKWYKVELMSKKGVKCKGLELKKRLSASFNAHDWCSPACLQLLVLFSVDIAIHNHLPPIMLPYSSFGWACYTFKGRVLRVTIVFNLKIRLRKDAFKQTSPEKIYMHGNDIKSSMRRTSISMTIWFSSCRIMVALKQVITFTEQQ